MRSIFAEEVGGYRAMPQAQIFDPLTRLVNEVTGDGTFRFHHLRHSFVSLVFLRLIENWPGSIYQLNGGRTRRAKTVCHPWMRHFGRS